MLKTETKQTEKTKTTRQSILCYHCDAVCPDNTVALDDKHFCCAGCQTVFEFLSENSLTDYYADRSGVGTRPDDFGRDSNFAYLDDPEVVKRLVDYADDKLGLIRLNLPTIHCSSCVYLLENLFSLHEGVLQSELNFPKRELKVKYDSQKVTLRQLVELLARLGYRADFNLSHLNQRKPKPGRRGLYLRIGMAGFAFGNIMLFAFPEYLGLSDPSLKQFFGYISLGLSLPVLFYSASGYFGMAWKGLRAKRISIDLPIALGVATLFLRSFYEIVWEAGQGYLDSMSGLVFFLLIGKLFQQKTYDHLSFDRDYQEYFPIAVLRRDESGERTVPLTSISVGDRLLVRHRELIPSDSRLLSGRAVIDYSFVTGESAPREINTGQTVYAGGRQLGGAIEIEVTKEVSAGFLTSLWSSQSFTESKTNQLSGLIDSVARVFTPVILLIGFGAAAYWLTVSIGTAISAFSAVLIVACPCALALSAPFAWGTSLRIMGQAGLYLGNPAVVERLSNIKNVLFDKTGTLTPSTRFIESYTGRELSDYESGLIGGLAAHSTHPISRALSSHLGRSMMAQVERFNEFPGEGIEGMVAGKSVRLGKPGWVSPGAMAVGTNESSSVAISIESTYVGTFYIKRGFRSRIAPMLESLKQDYKLALLSGDNESERAYLVKLFGPSAEVRFNQSPHDKLEFVRHIGNHDGDVLMIGDGLNDAGALKAASVGLALSEDTAAFSPACDAIIEAGQLERLPEFLRLAYSTRNVIIASVAISFIYNLVGLSLAVSGRLSPLVAAILMPLSSISVVTFATLSVRWLAKQKGVLK